MKRALPLLSLLLLFAACSGSQYTPTEHYGLVEEEPIRVAGLAGFGAASERAYLDQLRGPQGETVTYERLGSCCPFKTRRALVGNTALLDRYEVEYDGIDAPVTLYLNMYDPPRGPLRAPAGFTLAR